MKRKDSYYHALYDEKGKLLTSKQVEKNDAQTILQPVNQEYPGSGLKKDEHTKITAHRKKKDYYVISLANGNKVTWRH